MKHVHIVLLLHAFNIGDLCGNLGSRGGEACAVRDLSVIVMYRYPQHVGVRHITPARLSTPLYKTHIMPEQFSSFVPVGRSVVPHTLFS
jgi:hypothetical protein